MMLKYILALPLVITLINSPVAHSVLTHYTTLGNGVGI